MLERRGIISGYEGSKPRQVLIGEADVPRILTHLAEAERGASPAPAEPDPFEVPRVDEPAPEASPGPRADEV
jgi:DNA segregation ATPase FtsK/SpoIIIE, S-DNA-T family